MKAPFKFTAVLLGLMVGFAVPGISQDKEYDDMYFTKKDRKVKAETAVLVENVEANAEKAQEYVKNNEGSYSEQNVNPEYISRYGVTQTGDESSYNEDEYYTDTRPEDAQASDYQVPVVNNYYNYGGFAGGGYGYPGSFYSPYGFNRGWNVSIGIGFGFGWGSWGWGRPYYGWGRPYGWGAGFYDPFWGYDPFYGGFAGGYYGYGWGRPYYGGWGYPGYGWGYPGYGWGNTIIINNPEYANNVRRGAGPSRGSNGITPRRNSVSGSSYGRTATDRSVQTSRTASRSDYSGRTARTDYSSRTSRTADSQSNYYRRTRTASANSTYSSRDLTSRSRSNVSTNSNYTPRSRQSYSNTGSTSRAYTPNSSYNRRTSPVYNGRSSSGSRSYTPSRSSSGSRSYTPSRSSGSRSYTPSRSSGSRSYTPSRSSSGSSRSYSPSRSSSGSSSGSRSSGGASRSSSGSSKRGN